MPESPPPTVTFHYLKGHFFRVIHADGGIGGITPSRGIFMSLYSERAAIPNVIINALKEDGTLGEEVSRESKPGIVREVEVGVMLTPKSAKMVADWLCQQLKILEESNPETAPKSAEPVSL